MNQLQLPVDVHFVVEEDGRSTLLIGGYAMPFPAAKLPEVLSSPRLKQGRPRNGRAKRAKLKVVKGGKKDRPNVHNKSPEWIRNIAEANRKRAAERLKKGLCLRCDGKPKEGMKLCSKCIDKTSRAAVAARKAA